MANSIQQANEPTLASVLALHKENMMSSINCHQVGEIVSFDASTQTAEVQIKMLRMMNGELKSYPVLVDCPCIVLSGGLGRLTFPIKAGDSCLVFFNDKDLDNWYEGGPSVAPRTDRRHNFADAIALVGPRNKQNAISDYLTTGTELRYNKSIIKLEDNDITITNDTSTVRILGNDVNVTNGTSAVDLNGNTLTVTAPIINVNGNMNVVQNNVDNNSLHAYIIASYHSGTDWYRVYSDKWCEQGGFLAATSSGTKNFLKPYTQVAGVYFGCITTRSGSSYDKELFANSVTNTGFTYTNITSTSGGLGAYWKAEGYIS